MQSPTEIANDALSQLGAALIDSIDTTTLPNAVLCKQYYDMCWMEVLQEYYWRECIKRTEPYKQELIDASNSLDTDVVIVNGTSLIRGTDWSNALTLANAITALDHVSATYSGDVVTAKNQLTYDMVISKSEEAGLIWLSSDYSFSDYQYTVPSDFVSMVKAIDDNGLDITENVEVREDLIFSDESTIYIEYISSDGILLSTYGNTTHVPLYVQHLAALLIASKIAFRITQNDSLMRILYQEYNFELQKATMRNAPKRGIGGETYWGDV